MWLLMVGKTLWGGENLGSDSLIKGKGPRVIAGADYGDSREYSEKALKSERGLLHDYTVVKQVLFP